MPSYPNQSPFLRRSPWIWLSLLAAAALAPIQASAQTTASEVIGAEPFEIGFGVQLGGYQYLTGEAPDWDDNPMSGLSLFGTLDFNPALFAELSAGYYGAVGELNAYGIESSSLQMQAAAGVRIFPEDYITPYVQVGVGGEFVSIETATGRARSELLPTAFIGVGGEIRATRNLWLGANLRVHAMAHAVGPDEALAADASDEEAVPLEYAPTTMFQLVARYAL